MARREWVLKIVGKQVFHDRRYGPIVNFPRAVKLVKTEHARAVRIVKRLKQGYEKRNQDGIFYDRIDTCEYILHLLTKGRA